MKTAPKTIILALSVPDHGQLSKISPIPTDPRSSHPAWKPAVAGRADHGQAKAACRLSGGGHAGPLGAGLDRRNHGVDRLALKRMHRRRRSVVEIAKLRIASIHVQHAPTLETRTGDRPMDQIGGTGNKPGQADRIADRHGGALRCRRRFLYKD